MAVSRVSSSPKYVSPSPQAEILGAGIIAFEQSVEMEEFVDLLEKYKLRNIDPNRWYPIPVVMQYFKEVAARPNASTNMVSMGINVYKNIKLPEGIETIEDGLRMLAQITVMNVRNAPGAENWFEFIPAGEHCVRLIDRSPSPHDAIYGFIYGIVKRLAPPGARPIVKRTFLNEADPDADGAIYDITW
jgi:hypothetical protein